MATIRSIAEDTKLSAATVSRALRGNSGVNASTREKVRMAAERLGYLKSRASEGQKSIALLVCSKSAAMHELSRRYVLVVNEEFSKRGWQLHPVYVPEDEVQAEEVLSRLGLGAEIGNGNGNSHRMDGCLVISALPPHFAERFHPTLAEAFSNNVVMISRHDVINGLSGVTAMHYAGGVQAAQALLDAGHRRIGWIGSLGSTESAVERLGGVLATLRQAGADLSCELWLNDCELLPAATVAASLARVLPQSREQWPTAWVCCTDWLAAKLIVWARSQGLDVPGDLSVVAFDNTHVAEDLAETLITSVVFPYEQMVRKAVELLESLMAAPAADSIVWSLPPRLRVGSTVATLNPPSE